MIEIDAAQLDAIVAEVVQLRLAFSELALATCADLAALSQTKPPSPARITSRPS
jgi:hypothetical protein